MTTRHYQVITKVLVSAAIAVSCYIALAAQASADESTVDPNPFGSLSCGCQGPAPAAGPAVQAELERGIHGGLTATFGYPSPR